MVAGIDTLGYTEARLLRSVRAELVGVLGGCPGTGSLQVTF